MVQFEYLIRDNVNLLGDDPRSASAQLNGLGEDRWRLVEAFELPATGEIRCVFMRPAMPPPPDLVPPHRRPYETTESL